MIDKLTIDNSVVEGEELSPQTIPHTAQDLLDNFGCFASYFTDDEFFQDILPNGKLGLHEEVGAFLDKFNAGVATIVLPRGFLKSHICSILYPLWLVTRNPQERVLIVSKTMANAMRFLAKIRGIVEMNSLYRYFFGDRIPESFAKVRWSDTHANLKRTVASDVCNFEAAGLGTGVTGRHYTTIIEDDTVAPDLDEMTKEMAMPSPQDIEHAIGFHKLTNSLVIDILKDKRLVVGTRWTFHDLIKYVMQHDNPELFERSCHNDEDKPTYPLRFNEEVLNALQKSYGTYYFSALYKNMPREITDAVFREAWMQYYDTLPETGKSVISIDPSGLTETGSKDAIVSCRHLPGAIYVIRYALKLMQPTELINTALDFAELDGANTIVVETVAYQKSLVFYFEQAMRERGRYFNIVPIRPHREKLTRIRALQPFAERRMLFINKGMRELIQHMLDFPYGDCLDLLDALAHQLTQVTPGAFKREEKGWTPHKETWDDVLDRINRSGQLYPIPSGLQERVPVLMN